MRTRENGTGGLIRYDKNGHWFAQYYINGQRIRTSLKTKSKQEARVKLNRLVADRDAGKLPTAVQGRVTYSDLRAKLLMHYQTNNLKSLLTTKDGESTISGLEALDSFFPLGTKASTITSASRDAFVLARQKEGIGNAFINRSLGFLIKMFNLAIDDGTLSVGPRIKLLREPPARKGFVTREQFDRINKNLPPHLRSLATLLFYTGVRLGEAKQIRWDQVSLKSGLIRLDGDQSKNEEPRSLPMPDVLIAMIKDGPVKPPEPIKSKSKKPKKSKPEFAKFGPALAFSHQNFTKAWRQACVDAGLGAWRDPKNRDAGYDGIIVHDLRRSAIKQLVDSGVSQVVAMRISGHKTASVFQRYQIANDADVVAAMRRVQAASNSQVPDADSLNLGRILTEKSGGSKK